MNEPIRVLIVDDEPAARSVIRTLLAGEKDVVIAGECRDGREALAALRQDRPDLVFLDIQMPEMDGITMLRQLDLDTLPLVVFITAYDAYALRAFELHALDYLLKPFDDERFATALARAREQVRQRRAGELNQQLRAWLETMAGAGGPARYLSRLAIKDDGRVAIVAVDTVDWFEAERDYINIHCGKVTHTLRETMKRLEEQLDPARFVRIHRSTIVNIDRVRELQPWFRGEYVVVLADGTKLKLSRGYREHLEQVLGRAL